MEKHYWIIRRFFIIGAKDARIHEYGQIADALHWLNEQMPSSYTPATEEDDDLPF